MQNAKAPIFFYGKTDGDILASDKEKPRREAERTMTYVSIHDEGFDAVSRKIAPSGQVDAEEIAKEALILQKLRAPNGNATGAVLKMGEGELEGLLEILFEPGDAGGAAGEEDAFAEDLG